MPRGGHKAVAQHVVEHACLQLRACGLGAKSIGEALVKLFSFDQDYTKLARFLTLCREWRVQRSV
jgi:hypothetical protein